ncbi:hypothetical protein FJZ31_25575 [Candidatus Poribacteria bacterium]|nr:hypothetical protein [Candidatus Poribacteria bacterium]
MRCSTAAIQALVLHPQYRNKDGILTEAVNIAQHMVRKTFDFTFVRNLPPDSAREIITPEIPRILKTQRSSGMWKIEDVRRISYDVLSTLQYSGILAELLNASCFRHDPFQSFREEKDYYAFVVRRNIMGDMLNEDASLQRELIANILSKRNEYGDWNGTVISTSNHLAMLVELGIASDDSRLRKSVDWLLSVCIEDVPRFAKKFPGVVVAHHMFSTESREAEFQSAKEEKSEWNPCGGCYRHLPMIQTGFALKVLIRLGYENDEKVIAACDNLLELRRTYGGWCDSNIRNGLLAQQKAERQRSRSN